jgi:hypothetical protein
MLLLLLLLSLTRMARAELFPVIVFTYQTVGPTELSINPDTQVPTIFQYRITDGALKPGPTWYSDDDLPKSRPPWFDDTQVLAKLPSKQARVNCHAYISQGTVPIKRSKTGAVENVRLEPVPTQQLWNNNLLKTNSPGQTLNRVSSCCEQSKCPSVCLQGDVTYRWSLEILAPRWGFDETVMVYNRQPFGGGAEMQATRTDPGVWPVFRVPCDFCPIQSCNTTCVNGEYATDNAVYSAVRALFFPLWVTVWRDLRSFGRTASSGTRSSAGPARRARGTPARSRACSIASGGNIAPFFFSCLTPLDPTRPTPEKYPGISGSGIPGYFGWISGRVGRVKRES